MDLARSITEPLEATGGGQPVPRLAKAGVLVIAAGLAIDLAAHTFLHSVHDELIGAFPLEEHFAHLVVVIGMVLVLAGIVADGVRSKHRHGRQEGQAHHAIR